MGQAKQGDTVQVHYTGSLDDGTVFDSSADREPLQFTVGTGQVIPGFDAGVLGMEIGGSKTVNIPAHEAYGAYREELVFDVRDQLPPTLEVEQGQQLQLVQDNGQQVMVVVREISESKVTLDANHPLAGQALNFEIELVGIQ